MIEGVQVNQRGYEGFLAFILSITYKIIKMALSITYYTYISVSITIQY